MYATIFRQQRSKLSSWCLLFVSWKLPTYTVFFKFTVKKASETFDQWNTCFIVSTALISEVEWVNIRLPLPSKIEIMKVDHILHLFIDQEKPVAFGTYICTWQFKGCQQEMKSTIGQSTSRTFFRPTCASDSRFTARFLPRYYISLLLLRTESVLLITQEIMSTAPQKSHSNHQFSNLDLIAVHIWNMQLNAFHDWQKSFTCYLAFWNYAVVLVYKIPLQWSIDFMSR